jgi:hypothetical protein
MIAFLSNNAGTIITGLVLLIIVVMIVVKIYRDKKKGGCAGCSCDCGSCEFGAKRGRD